MKLLLLIVPVIAAFFGFAGSLLTDRVQNAERLTRVEQHQVMTDDYMKKLDDQLTKLNDKLDEVRLKVSAGCPARSR